MLFLKSWTSEIGSFGYLIVKLCHGMLQLTVELSLSATKVVWRFMQHFLWLDVDFLSFRADHHLTGTGITLLRQNGTRKRGNLSGVREKQWKEPNRKGNTSSGSRAKCVQFMGNWQPFWTLLIMENWTDRSAPQLRWGVLGIGSMHTTVQRGTIQDEWSSCHHHHHPTKSKNIPLFPPQNDEGENWPNIRRTMGIKYAELLWHWHTHVCLYTWHCRLLATRSTGIRWNSVRWKMDDVREEL